MEVKAGYKQTDIGIIPEDWLVKPLTGLAVILHGFGFQSQYFTLFGNFRLTTPGHFYEEGGFRDLGDKQKYYDGPLPSGYLLNEGDMIVAMTEQADGLLGSAALVPISGTYLHNQRLGKVKILSPELSIRYLYLVFNSRGYRAKVRETAAGTKVKHTSPTKLLEIPIPIPPNLAEQEAIAEVLSDADALIEVLEQLIAKKRQVKQGAMQELLTGKRRLPGFNGEWVEKKLDEFVNIFKGSGLSKNKIVENGKTKCILYGELFTTYGRVINDVVSSTNSNEGILSIQGDVLMPGSTTTTGIDLAIASALMISGVALGGDVNIIRGKKTMPYSPETLANYLTYVSRNAIAEITQGITIHHLYGKNLKTLSVKLPEYREQTAIAEILSDMDAEIAALEGKLSKARQVKQGMMSVLLTGRVRLV